MVDIGIKLREFFESKGITQKELAERLKVTPQYINALIQGRKEIGKKNAEKLANLYGLSKSWLLTGEGEMFANNEQTTTKNQDDEKTDNGDLVWVIPTRAMGGSLAEFANSVHQYECERAVSPIKGADYIITVTGYSMEPEYPNGSKVVIKKINERAFIDWGRTYVLDTCNGAVIKKIMPGSTPECVRCVSVNPEFPDFEISFTDMNGMYRVMMLMCEK